MLSVQLSPAAQRALWEWNMRNYGRGVSAHVLVKDPEVLARLQCLQGPDESLDEVIIRLCNQGGSAVQ